MAGSIRARLDCLSSAGGANTTVQTNRNLQAMFATIWNFLDAMEAAGRITRIASNYGNAASAAQIAPPTNTRGIGYWDEAVNFGYDAFGVWRFDNAAHPFYLFLELAPAQGNTLPNQSTILSSVNVFNSIIGISVAWGLDGGGSPANPWLGGDANVGADARANGSNQRWGDPGGGLWVLPRSNMLYGGAVTNKNNSTSFVHAANSAAWATGVAYNIWADDDSFIVAYDGLNANAWSVNGSIRYTPRTGITHSRPYCLGCLNSGIYPPWGTIGSTSTASDFGGILMPDGYTASPVRPFYTDRYAFQTNTTYQPSNIISTNIYDEFSMKAVATEASTTNAYGLCGDIDSNMIREVYNIVSANTNPDKTRIFLGSATTATVKMSMKWDGTTIPRTYAGATDAIKRVGVQGTNTATVI